MENNSGLKRADNRSSRPVPTIMDILNTLPDEKQEALVTLVANTARLMQK